MIVNDGAGTGSKARVDVAHRLHSGSIVRPERDAAIVKGSAFLAVSSVPTLTNAVNTPVLYIKNGSDDDLMIYNLFLSLGTSTAGVGNAQFKVYKNIEDTSTIVSTATLALVSNMNVGSALSFVGDSYKGVTGQTIVGGVSMHTALPMPETILDIDIAFMIPKGANMAFSVVPPTSNTSMDIMLAVTCYYVDGEMPI